MELILCLASAMFLGLWIVTVAKFHIVKRNARWLHCSEAFRACGEKISVIIPARNEERDIKDCVESILAQEGVDLEIVAVNDGSTDRTGEILDQMAKRYPQVQVIHNPPLAAGWLGKVNAMRHGLLAAKGRYIVFGDADLLYQPGCFAMAVSEFERGRYDLISLFPALVIKPLWENIILPMYISGFAKFVKTDKAEDPGSPHAAAAGAFMLIKREVIEAIGGLESIKGEMADDVALAKVVKGGRYRIGYRLAPECLRVELFKNNADAFSNTTKNVLMIVQGRRWLAIPLILYSLFLFWLPPAIVVMGLLAGHTTQVAMGAGMYLVQYASLFVAREILQFHPLKAAFFPLAVIVVGYSVSRALYYGLRGEVWWRGRAIRVG
jgi:glycosyltransferase involved in cell wall biosynthesis